MKGILKITECSSLLLLQRLKFSQMRTLFVSIYIVWAISCMAERPSYLQYSNTKSFSNLALIDIKKLGEDKIDSIITLTEKYRNANEIFDTTLVVKNYHNIGLYYFVKNKYIKSIEFNQNAATLRVNINNNLLWKSYRNIGMCYKKLNEHKKAIYYFEAAINAYKDEKSRYNMSLLKNLAHSWIELGEYDRAINLLASKLMFNTTIDSNDFTAKAFNELADAFFSTKNKVNITKAFECLKRSVKISRILNDKKTEADSNTIYAKIYDYLEDYESMIKYSKLLLEIEDIDYQAFGRSNIAVALFGQKKYETSISQLNESLEILRGHYNSTYNFNYFTSLENLGDNYAALNLHDTALYNYQKALINLTNNFRNESIFQNPNPKDTSLFIYSNLHMIRVLHLKATAAYQYYQQNKNEKYLSLANQTYQSLIDFHNKLPQDISTENSRLFQAKNILPYIENALKIAYQQQENGKDISKAAFRFMEKNKATVLLQSMNEADALQFANLPDSLLELEKDLKIAITYHTKQLNEAIEYKDTTEIERLNEVLFDEKQQYSQLITNLENNYPNYYRLKYQQNQTHLKEVQQSLDDQTALVEYFVGDSAIYILSIVKDNSHLYQVKKPDNWKQTINNLRQSIADINNYDKAAFVMNARSLSQLVVDSLLCDLPDEIKRLQIIPDAELNYIPFEVLLTEVFDESHIQYKNLNYLLKSKSIGYAYSAALWLENKQSTSSAKTFSYAGYAPVYYNYDTTFYDLPAARETVKFLADLLDGKEYVKEQATQPTFLNNISSFKILHLAMHGVLDDKNPLSSYLAFTKSNSDFKLHAYDLYNQKLNTDLAILHACDTGTGELQKGEGVMSLSRAFTYAGCPSLVMSLWKIPEEATAEITKSFIQYLLMGETKDVALQQAKLDYLNNTSKTKASPAYWAGLVATGNLNPISLD